MYKRLDVLEFPPHQTTVYAALKRLKNLCIRLFSAAIDPILLNLQMSSKCIISWLSENFGQIGPQTTDLDLPLSI